MSAAVLALGLLAASASSGSSGTPCPWNGRTSFVDPRDRRTYRQLQVGDRCWMAENLLYGQPVEDMAQADDEVPETSCLDDRPDNCARFGGLYTWGEARGWEPADDETVSGLCPPGWRLPTDAEWTRLERSLDPQVSEADWGWRGVDVAFRLQAAREWAGRPPVPASGFDARPGGTAVSGWAFYAGRGAYFWTATRYSAAAAWSRALHAGVGQVYRGPADVQAGASVRCTREP